MADANRSKLAAGRAPSAPASTPAEPVDPRIALAQKYLRSAASELAAQEKELPRSRRPATAGGKPTPFTFSVAPATLVHVLLASFAVAFSACAVLWCYILLSNMLTISAGRVIAGPTGFVLAATLGYLSICLLDVIESTSAGRTVVDVLDGDWRDWFWTLPMTLGMAALAAGFGWLLSLVLPINAWLLIAASLLLLYPVLQLSALETGSPLVPLSVIVVRSLVKHPYVWLILYAVSFAMIQSLWIIFRLTWFDPPFPTVIVVGLLATVALFFYAWLLGQLAHLIGSGE